MFVKPSDCRFTWTSLVQTLLLKPWSSSCYLQSTKKMMMTMMIMTLHTSQGDGFTPQNNVLLLSVRAFTSAEGFSRFGQGSEFWPFCIGATSFCLPHLFWVRVSTSQSGFSPLGQDICWTWSELSHPDNGFSHLGFRWGLPTLIKDSPLWVRDSPHGAGPPLWPRISLFEAKVPLTGTGFPPSSLRFFPNCQGFLSGSGFLSGRLGFPHCAWVKSFPTVPGFSPFGKDFPIGPGFSLLVKVFFS